MNNEPVAWIHTDSLEKAMKAPFLCRVEPTNRLKGIMTPIYTHPVKQLTKEEVRKVWLSLPYDPDNAPYIFADAILRKAQEK